MVLTYSLESIVAEKLDTIIARMNMNSRMNDFYDLYYIPSVYHIDGRALHEAVFQTLQRRGTAYGGDTLERIRGLARDADVRSRWSRFSKKTLGLEVSLEEVMHRERFMLLFSPGSVCVIQTHLRPHNEISDCKDVADQLERRRFDAPL